MTFAETFEKKFGVALEQVSRKAPDAPDEKVGVSVHATPYVWQEPQTIAPRQWLYGRHYIRRYVTATVAPGGLGKSSNALVETLAMVTGRDLLGVQSKRPLRLWYWNGEDPREEVDRRIAAICKHFEISACDIGGRLHVDSGRQTPITIAEQGARQATVNAAVVESLTRELREKHIDCLIIDPFVSSHRVPENDNGAIELVAQTYGRIAESAGCAIELIHHLRKPPPGNGSGERTIDDARGAGALINAARSARVLNVMTESEAQGVGVKSEERKLHFRIDNGKANMQPPADKAEWRKLVSVPLGNGTDDEPEDWVGVATKWDLPGAFEDVTTAHLERVQDMVRQGNYRQSPQSRDWVGGAVAETLNLDLDSPGARLKVNKILKLWFANKQLVTVWRKDAGRRQREFVMLGPGPEGGDENRAAPL